MEDPRHSQCQDLISCPPSCLLSSRKAMLLHPQKCQSRRWEGSVKVRKPRNLVNVQVLGSEEEMATSSACLPSTSTPLVPVTLMEEPAYRPLICPKIPERSSPISVPVPPNPCVPPAKFPCLHESRGPIRWKNPHDRESLLGNPLDEKMADLVQFLLLKYQLKQSTTKEEMLSSVLKYYENDFPVIFRVASECLQLIFGIDIKAVSPFGHCYTIVNALGLSYDGMLGDAKSMPKTGLLIIVLCVIFIEGDRAREEAVWEMLNVMGVYAGRKHFIYGDPRKLITEDLVQEQYLVYRQVSGGDPASHEFLWGPRAHTETSKMKVLEYWARVHGTDPHSYPSLYENALRDQEEGKQVPISVRTTRRARAPPKTRKRSRTTIRTFPPAM